MTEKKSIMLEDIQEDYIYFGPDYRSDGGEINDVVNKPKHYRFGNFELIDVIDALLTDGGFSPIEAFYGMTILQYIVRAPKKNGIQDLLKAQYYLNRLIRIEEENT